MRPLWLVVVVGCGRIGFDGAAPAGGDAQLDGSMIGVFGEIALAPGGGARAVAAPPGLLATVYAAFAGGRTFRTDDGGSTWRECGAMSRAADQLVLPSSETLYAVGGGKVFASTDGCQTFVDLAAPDYIRTVALQGTAIVVGGDAGLRRYNGSWSALASPFDSDIVMDVETLGSRIVVASFSAGLGAFDGSTWSTMNVGRAYDVDIAPGDTMRYYAATENGLYRSTNGGTSWTLARSGYHDVVAVDPGSSQRLLVMAGTDVRQSLDGGNTWSPDTRTAVMGNARPTDIMFVLGGTAFVACGHGLFRADDTALAWRSAIAGVSAWDIRAVGEVADTTYVATSGGMWVSTGGGPWQLTATSIAGTSVLLGLGFDANPDRVYALGDAFARSPDRGGTFQVIFSPAQIHGWEFHAFAAHGGRKWLASYLRVTYSDDDGASWTPGNVGSAYAIRGLLVRPGGNEVVITSDTGLHWSTDGGVNYSSSFAGLGSIRLQHALAELGDGRVAVATEDGLWVAAGPGQAWTRLAFEGESIRDVLAYGTKLVVATERGVFWSADGGASWQELAGLAGRWPANLAVGEQGTLLVGSHGYGLFRTPLP